MYNCWDFSPSWFSYIQDKNVRCRAHSYIRSTRQRKIENELINFAHPHPEEACSPPLCASADAFLPPSRDGGGEGDGEGGGAALGRHLINHRHKLGKPLLVIETHQSQIDELSPAALPPSVDFLQRRFFSPPPPLSESFVLERLRFGASRLYMKF